MKEQILKISIRHSEAEISLIREEKECDFESWKDENNMSKKLLEAIDTLLQRNKMRMVDIARIEIDSNQQSYTSTRIAKAVSETVGCCLD